MVAGRRQDNHGLFSHVILKDQMRQEAERREKRRIGRSRAGGLTRKSGGSTGQI
jgi:hypothetical protein